MKSIRYVALAVLCVVLMAAHDCNVGVVLGGARVWVTEETDLTQTAEGLEALGVKTDNGAITVTGSEDVRKIAVHVTKKAGGSDETDAAECMKAIEIVSKVEGGTYQLGWKWAAEKKPAWQAGVSFDVKLPNEMTVGAVSHNGQIKLSNMVAGADLLTHNGAVKVDGLAADLKAVTHNGHVHVADLTGDLAVETHNGGIDVHCVSPKVRAVTYNGSVDADLSGSQVVNGEITTHNGSVTVDFGDEVSARLTCSTGNGRIHADRPIETTVAKKKHLEGQIGGGDGRLEIQTHNGSITLK